MIKQKENCEQFSLRLQLLVVDKYHIVLKKI